jgi:DNA-binding beta-propeller fold protein YncE
MSEVRSGWVGFLTVVLAILGLSLAGGCTSDGPGLPEHPPAYVLDWGSTGNPESNLQWPIDVAVGPDGSIYVAAVQSGRVLKFTPEGGFLAAWDIAALLDSEALPGGVFHAATIAVDSEGSIFASDSYNDCSARIDTRSGAVEVWSYDAAVGGLDVAPDGTVFLAGAHVYVSEHGAYPNGGQFIWKLSREGDVLAKWTPEVPPGRTWQAGPLACTPGGGVLVIDAGSNRVQEYNATGALVSDWGLVDPLGNEAMGLALSPDGRVFVSRRRDSAVEIYSRTGRLLSVLGEYGLDPGQFNIPTGLAVDASGALYVAEFYGHRVQKFAYL